MTIMWYLVFFGWDQNAAVSIPQISRERCIQQATWINAGFKPTDPHAYCIEGVKP